MAISMTIGGVSATPLNGSLNINDNINDRSTASFTIHTTSTTYSIGQEVIVLDGATRIFGGTIEEFSYTILKGTTTKEYTIECLDFNQITDRIRIAETYEDQTVTAIVTDIITNYLADDGISLGTTPISVPTITQANFNYIQVSDALSYIQDVTQINWNIDYNKNLNLFYRTDNITTGLTDANILDLVVSGSRTQYRNIQYLKAGDGTTELQTDEKPTPEPDGVSETFLVRFQLAKKPTITVNSVDVDGDDVGINGLDTGKKWYWNKNKKEIVQDDSETILTSTDTLEITYYGLVPILAKVENTAEISSRQGVEGGSGVYEGFEKRVALSDKAAAISYAQGLLNKFDQIPEVLTLTTKTFKQAGKIININSATCNINDDYLIESVNITESAGTLYYDITLLSGESFGSWVEFFRKMIATADDFIIQENELVLRVKSDNEKRSRTGTNNIKTFAPLFPADDLYPSDTLYPNTAVLTEEDYDD